MGIPTDCVHIYIIDVYIKLIKVAMYWYIKIIESHVLLMISVVKGVYAESVGNVESREFLFGRQTENRSKKLNKQLNSNNYWYTHF